MFTQTRCERSAKYLMCKEEQGLKQHLGDLQDWNHNYTKAVVHERTHCFQFKLSESPFARGGEEYMNKLQQNRDYYRIRRHRILYYFVFPKYEQHSVTVISTVTLC